MKPMIRLLRRVVVARSSGAVLLLGLLMLGAGASARAIPIAGANGKVVDFSGVKSAGPAGLKVIVRAGGNLVEVPWEKFDLNRLEQENPKIFAAYQKALNGESVELNLGSFAPKAAPGEPANPEKPAVKNFLEGAERHGWHETRAGGGKFAIQLPEREPRGVLLISFGQNGDSIQYIGGIGASRWTELSEKFQFAVMSYDFSSGNQGTGATGEPPKVPPFVGADEGSGEAVFEALKAFAKKSGKTSLAEAPIAVYGSDVLGAAFAFNFSQSHPGRVLAAVASKGAFYSVRPTEASARVPLLLLWGEYNRDAEQWNPTDTHDEIYPAGVKAKANWIYAMEPRGAGGVTPLSHKMATTFLDRMILARLNPEGGIKELDRSRAWIGDVDTLEIKRMEDQNAALLPTQSWLPDGEIAKLWEGFSKGDLDILGPTDEN